MPASWRGVVRPLACWACVSVLLLGWQYHVTESARAIVRFSVALEGRKVTSPASAWLNEQPYDAGQPSGVGWKKLVLNADGFERFETNCFVGYGGKEIGNITLARSRGQLELTCIPLATRVSITGDEGIQHLTNIALHSLTLPTGRYQVEARFTRFAVEETVEVGRNQNAQARFKPLMTAVQVSSEPEGAEFELTSDKSPRVTVSGTTPALLTELPTGGYKLAIARGDYRQELRVSLDATKATNELVVPFRYAKLSITSNPDGAIVRAGGGNQGKTPTTLELPPGKHQLWFTKEDHFPTNLVVTLTETDTKTVAVELVNKRFVEAMENARRKSASGIDPDRALVDIDEALLIKPGDETALALQREIRFDRHMRRAWLLERQSGHAEALVEAKAALKLNPNDAKAVTLNSDLEKAQREVTERNAQQERVAEAARKEARRKHPLQVVQNISSRFRHDALFETQVVRFGGALDAARAGVMRALLRHKPEFAVTRDDSPDADTILLLADTKGFGWKQNVVLAMTRTADNEVIIAFKLFAFVLSNNIQLNLNGLSEESYQPKHPKFSAPGAADGVEASLSRDTQGLKKRIEQELR